MLTLQNTLEKLTLTNADIEQNIRNIEIKNADIKKTLETFSSKMLTLKHIRKC